MTTTRTDRRIQSIHSHLRTQRHLTANQNQNPRHHLRAVKATRRARADNMASVFLVVRRKPLSALPLLWRWLISAVYFKTGWASDFSVEYQGVYTDEAEARWAASGPGMSYTELPLNSSLPEETCQFGTHDFPLSDGSNKYRRRKLPFVAVSRAVVENVAALEKQVDELDGRIVGRCIKTA